MRIEFKNRIAQLVYIGAPFTSVLIVTGIVTDPVNLTKQTSLGIFAMAIAAVFLVGKKSQFFSEDKFLLVCSAFFLLSALSAIFFSDSPLSQGFYGVYGRSTGFLTYFALVFFMIGAAQLDQKKWHKKLIIGFVSVGAINVLYCSWVLAFGDFIGWSNPYGEILGLFGNPNFIGAFLGMFVVGTTAIILGGNISSQLRIIGILFIGLAFYEILKSRAIQGLVVTAGGLAVLSLLFLWTKRVKISILVPVSLTFLTLATLSVMGALQKGPFIFIYKRSVSLRGTYWKSGLEMGLENPFTGVGMDSYGDWYRRARPPIALIDMPGVGTVTNAAHNVVLDIFAYGGFPLFISYMAILSLGVKSIYGSLRKIDGYDPIFAFLMVVWACYQVQSLISINQIGIAVWGWVLTGALISYEKILKLNENIPARTQPDINQIRRSTKQKSGKQSASITLATSAGVLSGLILFLPPLSSDYSWYSALKSRNLEKIEASLNPTFFNPSNSHKYVEAVVLFQNNNLSNLALKYAKAAVAFNPDDFQSWQTLYLISDTPVQLKREALVNLKRLDPLNPDVTLP